MNFANLHQNFILLSPLTLNQHLGNHGFWPAFIAEATPFVRNIKSTPRINAGQFDGGNRLTALLQTTLCLKKQRQYAYPCNGSTHGAWTNCIMDLSPADAAEPNSGGWTINEEFADWAKF